MPRAKVSDIEMYYEEVGEGPPLLMSSGWSLAGRNFGGIVPALSQKYRCIRHDHRCMGRSDAPDGPLTIEMMADDLAGLLDHLKIERTRMIGGGGMGARVGMALAIRHPDRISALELGSPVLKSDAFSRALSTLWKKLRRLDPVLWAEEVTLWSYTPATYNERPEIPEHAFKGRAGEKTFPTDDCYDRIVDAMLALDLRDRAHRIACPTLITSGGIQDAFSGARYAIEVHKAIPNSVLKVFENAAHGYPGEEKEAYIRLLLDWFDGMETEADPVNAACTDPDRTARDTASGQTPPPLLRVDGLRTVVRRRGGDIVVVDGVGLDLERGETVALVGESGSGKSLTALSIARLLGRHLATVSGSVRLDGRELLGLSEAEFRKLRGREIGMVFQEPMTSLNPILSIGLQLTEALRDQPADGRSARVHAAELLEQVGIPEPQRRLAMYPHQLSGGMRQRVMVAIALAGRPRVLIADEPTTALDVTTQAQILELIAQRQRALGAAMLLITHDLGVVARYARRVNVMYAGTIVERGAAAELFADPRHPYTRGLLRSIPRLDRPRIARLPAIDGLPPSPAQRPAGCPFQPRCAHRTARCDTAPPLAPLGPGREAACWFAAELPAFAEART